MSRETLSQRRARLEQRYAPKRAAITRWLESKGFHLMDDGTYHHGGGQVLIRVEFKRIVVRIDWLDDRFRYGIYEWRRLFSAHYARLRIDDTGKPHGLGFNSHPYLRHIAEGGGICVKS